MTEESCDYAMAGSLVYMMRMENPKFSVAIASCSSLVCSGSYTSLLLTLSYLPEISISMACSQAQVLQTPAFLPR